MRRWGLLGCTQFKICINSKVLNPQVLGEDATEDAGIELGFEDREEKCLTIGLL